MPQQRTVYTAGKRALRLGLIVSLVAAGLLIVVFGAAGQARDKDDASAPAVDNTYGVVLPDEMSYQGQLVDSNGAPQVGSYSFDFSVYGPPPNYTLRYTETQTVATDPDGLFNVMIGAVQPGLDAALAGGDAWLGIQVDGELLAPPQPIGTVPYAQYAQRLVGGTGDFSAISGGESNDASGHYAVIGGGKANQATDYYAAIGGGINNRVDAEWSTIAGGSANTVDQAWGGAIGGGFNNAITETWGSQIIEYSSIAGGRQNYIGGSYSHIGGGYNNTLDAFASTIAGGFANEMTGSYAAIGGGIDNVNTAFYGTIAGGAENAVSGTYAAIGGGTRNTASGAYSGVVGGELQRATGDYSVSLGGYNNEARGLNSIAMGRQALAADDYSFALNLASYNFSTQGERVFAVNAPGGIGFNIGFPQTGFHIWGQENGTATDVAAHVALIENGSTENSPDVLALAVDTLNPGGQVNYVTFFDSGGAIAAIEGNGAGGVAYVTSGADFAEYLPLAEGVDAAPGMVLGLSDGALRLETAGAERVVVVSTAPGFVGNATAVDDGSADGMALVALLGQVPVRVTGPVFAGDLLIASGRGDGTALAVSPDRVSAALAGQIIGRALADHTGTGVGTVPVLVGQPNDAVWADALRTTEARLDAMAAQLAALEARLVALEADQAADDE